MSRPALAIVLLNYNGAGLTIDCLDSLRAAELGDCRVIVVDNASEPGDLRALTDWNTEVDFFKYVGPAAPSGEGPARPRVHCLLKSKVNLGFAAGNNLGARVALEWGCSDVLLLNNDTTVAPGFLRELRAGRGRHPAAVLIPQIRLADQPARIWNCGGDLRYPGRKVYRYGGAPAREVPAADFPISFVTGCALLYQPAATGLLTEQFFFGEEDMEFSWRLRRLGVPAVCVPSSIIYHRVGSTLPTNPRKSEAFTLKRLVNLRNNKAGTEVAAGFLYYLANLFRLLVHRYDINPVAAARRIAAVYRAGRTLTAVGPFVSVAYVRGQENWRAAIRLDEAWERQRQAE